MESVPHYAGQVSWVRAEELKETYKLAVTRLRLESVLGWLETQPRHRIISEPQQALGCLLAAYLMSVTNQMWCVRETIFWHFSLSPRFAWTLPEWARQLVSLERRATQPLTVGDCIDLVQRAQRQPPLGLTFAPNVEHHEADAGDDHFSVESSA